MEKHTIDITELTSSSLKEPCLWRVTYHGGYGDLSWSGMEATSVFYKR